MKIGKKKAIGILMAMIMLGSIFAMISPASIAQPPVPPGSEAIYYLDPDNSSVPGYCSSTPVDIWLNVTNQTGASGGTFNITYTHCCANITSFTANKTAFDTFVGGDPTTTPGRLTMNFMNTAAFPACNQPPGVYHLGTFTVHCCNDSSCCVTNLKFSDAKGAANTPAAGELWPLPLATDDGTFMCGNPIEVNKTVWSKPKGDPNYNDGEWVDEIPDAQMDEVYRFNCSIHAKCCDLTNIEVTDTLSDSLKYAQGATVDGTPKAPDWISGNQFGWNFAGPLNPCNTIVIEFDARVVDYGYDCNIQNATAICEETGVEVSAWDEACINVPLPKPDLIVDSIKPNCGYLFGNESNEICAKITNLGAAANASNASFVLSDGYSEIVGVPALAAGTNTTVCVTDPTIRNAGAAVNINVTADCKGEIDESNETNNASDIDVTVVNNGYKGKRYTGGEDIKTVQSHMINGNLIYSVGDSYYLSGSTAWYHYTANWTAGDLPIPTDATIEKARLYVYYTYDKVDGMPDNVSLTFNGQSETIDAFYTDRKGHGSYDYPSGMLAYNVTNDFNVSGNNATLENLNPVAGNPSIQGMLLVVIYAVDSEPQRMIWINEECDLLAAKDGYCVNSTEATAFATFGGTVGIDTVMSAKLITVAPQASDGDDKNRLYFNGNVWKGIWDSYAGSTQLGINETDVKAYLNTTDNLAQFQSHIPEGKTKGDYMEASNAFLVLEKSGVKIGVEPPDTIVQPQDQFDVNITVEALGDTKVYGVEYYLKYNTSVVRAETQNKGPFLGGYSDTIVVINDIDQANGIVSYAETRKVPDGVPGKDTVATIQFTAIGARNATSPLDLYGVIIVDENKTAIPSVIITDGTVTINNNRPPVVIPTSKHRTNNVAKKYPCITKLCACKSYDPDEGKGGNISYVRWDFGDGQYGTSEGEFVENCTEGVNCTGCQKDHKYESWQWVPFGEPTGGYVPFNATLTLTDDGCPEETNSSYVLVNVSIAGDANGDGRVNILDAVYVGKHWGERCDTHWPPERCCWYWTNDRVQQDKADLNNDCVINILDAVIIGANWGHVAWE